MSRTEVTQITPSKLLSGGGDGVRYNNTKPDLRTPRTPVPSCRKFSTRNQRRDDFKHKLEKAIEERKVPSGPTRLPKLLRRSVSMAEITPSKNRRKRICKLATDGTVVASLDGTSVAGRAGGGAVDAGRLVYQHLLLNAWRQSKVQVSTLSESSRRLQDQVDQLQRQVEVLRDLRKSEGRRRSEAAMECSLLKIHLEEKVGQNKQLVEEKRLLDEKIVKLEIRVEELQTEVQNARNESLATRSELRISEQQLNKEREKIGKLRKERDCLAEKVASCDKVVLIQKEKLTKLEEELQNAEINLDGWLSTLTTTEETKNQISQKLEEEKQRYCCLEHQLINLTTEMKMFQKKNSELKESLEELRDSRKQISEENELLKIKLHDLEITLGVERRRPWWRNAGELAMAPLNALHNAAFVMLPALPQPQNVSRTTSTSDIFGPK